MKLSNSQLSYYVYLRISPKENWKACVKKLTAEVYKRYRVKYSAEEYGDCRKGPQDYFNDGTAGAPMYFTKKL